MPRYELRAGDTLDAVGVCIGVTAATPADAVEVIKKKWTPGDGCFGMIDLRPKVNEGDPQDEFSIFIDMERLSLDLVVNENWRDPDAGDVYDDLEEMWEELEVRIEAGERVLCAVCNASIDEGVCACVDCLAPMCQACGFKTARCKKCALVRTQTNSTGITARTEVNHEPVRSDSHRPGTRQPQR